MAVVGGWLVVVGVRVVVGGRVVVQCGGGWWWVVVGGGGWIVVVTVVIRGKRQSASNAHCHEAEHVTQRVWGERGAEKCVQNGQK